MTRYGLILKIDMENDAFADGRCADETARVLRTLADRLEGGSGPGRYALINGLAVDSTLYDINGNRCGGWEAKRRRIRD